MKLITDPTGLTISPRVVDLTEPGREPGEYRRSIVEVMPAAEYFSDLQEFADLPGQDQYNSCCKSCWPPAAISKDPGVTADAGDSDGGEETPGGSTTSSDE